MEKKIVLSLVPLLVSSFLFLIFLVSFSLFITANVHHPKMLLVVWLKLVMDRHLKVISLRYFLFFQNFLSFSSCPLSNFIHFALSYFYDEFLMLFRESFAFLVVSRILVHIFAFPLSCDISLQILSYRMYLFLYGFFQFSELLVY